MRTALSFPPTRRISRRRFLAGTTAGAAGSLLIPSLDLTAEAQRRGGGPDAGRVVFPPLQPVPAQFPGTGKYLYVTNDRGRRVDGVNNTPRQHPLLWALSFAAPGGRGVGPGAGP